MNRKKILILFIFTISQTFTLLFSQWEYTYFVLRTGANHNFMSIQPTVCENKYLKTEFGDMELYPFSEINVDEYVYDYNVGPVATLYIHFDSKTEKFGIVSGIEYSNVGRTSAYVTKDNEYYLNETYKMESIGIPVMVKLGKGLYEKQKYVFIGGKYTYNRELIHSQETNAFRGQSFTEWGNQAELKPNNIFVFLGFNYLIFNIEADLMLNTFLNKNYIDENSGIKIHKNTPDNIFFVKTSLTFPFTPWLSQQSYWLYKIKQKIRFW